MKKIIVLSVTLSLLFVHYAAGQNSGWCGTDNVMDSLVHNDPEFARNYHEAQDIINDIVARQNKNKQQAAVYVIPVVFHVIWDTHKDNISREQIEDGLRVLNEDFRRLNADTGSTRPIFKGVAADAEIEFRMAKIDPQGNCTDGITRTQSSLSVNARDNVKPLIQWDNKKYFNVWVVNSIDPQNNPGTVLGYAYLPVSNQHYTKDGMVIRHDRLGTIGTSQSLGRTFSHEAGHYLGLLHPFGNGNSCSQGDGVADTPPVASANFGCDFSANSCHNDVPDLPDMIENYMDYADDQCTNLFTLGQKTRMRASLESFSLRQNLRTASNLLATGVTNPPACRPLAIAEPERRVICAGETIIFRDKSENGDPTSWSWNFPGGNPGTSNLENPAVTYPVPGLYPVTLIAGNSAGSDTVTYMEEIHVKTPWTTVYYPNWSEDFEAASISEPDLTILDDGDGIEFELTSQASSSGSQSLKLNNYGSDVTGETDVLISPAINTIFTEDLSLSFDYAFAARTVGNNDVLNVYVSQDCGASWILRRSYQATQLATTSPVTQPFTPSTGDWSTKTINFGAFSSPDPILIKFEFINGGGNNFYLDNINFTGTIGLEEYYKSSFAIFPNPAKDEFTLTSESLLLNNTTVTLSDLSGKQLQKWNIASNSNTHTFDIKNLNLSSGVYLLTISADGKTANKKLVIK